MMLASETGLKILMPSYVETSVTYTLELMRLRSREYVYLHALQGGMTSASNFKKLLQWSSDTDELTFMSKQKSRTFQL